MLNSLQFTLLSIFIASSATVAVPVNYNVLSALDPVIPANVLSALDPVIPETAFNKMGVLERTRNSFLAQTSIVQKAINAERHVDSMTSAFREARDFSPRFVREWKEAHRVKSETRAELKDIAGIHLNNWERVSNIRTNPNAPINPLIIN